LRIETPAECRLLGADVKNIEKLLPARAKAGFRRLAKKYSWNCIEDIRATRTVDMIKARGVGRYTVMQIRHIAGLPDNPREFDIEMFESCRPEPAR
jgi:hypothetical protein